MFSSNFSPHFSHECKIGICMSLTSAGANKQGSTSLDVEKYHDGGDINREIEVSRVSKLLPTTHSLSCMVGCIHHLMLTIVKEC